MLNHIRPHSIKPMGRKAFVKRIVAIELIGTFGVFYYYANIDQFRRLIISLVKVGAGNMFGIIVIGLTIAINLLELNYISRRAKDAGISQLGVLAFIVLAYHFKLAKLIGLAALCIIEPVTIIQSHSSLTISRKITRHDSQDISVSDLDDLNNPKVGKTLKKLPPV